MGKAKADTAIRIGRRAQQINKHNEILKSKKYQCSLCNVSARSPSHLNLHFESATHKFKAAKLLLNLSNLSNSNSNSKDKVS